MRVTACVAVPVLICGIGALLMLYMLVVGMACLALLRPA